MATSNSTPRIVICVDGGIAEVIACDWPTGVEVAICDGDNANDADDDEVITLTDASGTVRYTAHIEQPPIKPEVVQEFFGAIVAKNNSEEQRNQQAAADALAIKEGRAVFGCPKCREHTRITELGTATVLCDGHFENDGEWENSGSSETIFEEYERKGFCCRKCGAEFETPAIIAVTEL